MLRARSKEFLKPLLVLLVALMFPLVGASEPGGMPIQWSVSDSSLATRTLVPGSSSLAIEMNEGWSCTVGAAATLAGGGEARVTVCSRGGESFEFAVECGVHSITDVLRVDLRDREGRNVDFIEVACKYSL